MLENHAQSSERRRRQRKTLRYSVTIESSQGVLSGETKNISLSGALIECACSEPILPSETLHLTFEGSSRPHGETPARVVWSSVPGFRDDSLICLIGVRFTR
jgi:hypothetical protein